MSKLSVLIIEDEENICNFIKTSLRPQGYKITTAATAAEGLSIVNSGGCDLVLLDLGLPDEDGMSFISKIRRSDSTPIIVLSARTQENDKVTALDAGANDYITKPFGTAELLARVRAALRNRRYEGIQGGEDVNGGYRFKDLEIDYARRLVRVREKEIKLTQTEYNIVALLSQHAGRVLTYASIIQAVWGSSDAGSIKKLQVNMANIRKKLGSRPGEKNYIVNELGVGYRMQDEA